MKLLTFINLILNYVLFTLMLVEGTIHVLPALAYVSILVVYILLRFFVCRFSFFSPILLNTLFLYIIISCVKYNLPVVVSLIFMGIMWLLFLILLLSKKTYNRVITNKMPNGLNMYFEKEPKNIVQKLKCCLAIFLIPENKILFWISRNHISNTESTNIISNVEVSNMENNTNNEITIEEKPIENKPNVVWILIKVLLFGFLAYKDFVVWSYVFGDWVTGVRGTTLFVILTTALFFLFFKFFKKNSKTLLAIITECLKKIKAKKQEEQKNTQKNTQKKESIITIKNRIMGFSEMKKVELLERYKALYDSGAITKEEYENKKTELL